VLVVGRPATYFPVYGLRIRFPKPKLLCNIARHGHNVRIDRRRTPVVFRAGVRLIKAAFLKFGIEVGVVESIENPALVSADLLPVIRIVHSQSTLQRELRHPLYLHFAT
jgi:hypothetical protein